jgi:hypothetical protein
MTHPKHIYYNNDEGVCQYRNCTKDIPDGISIQLCTKHLRLAYAAFLLAHGDELL